MLTKEELQDLHAKVETARAGGHVVIAKYFTRAPDGTLTELPMGGEIIPEYAPEYLAVAKIKYAQDIDAIDAVKGGK
jgi:hypothetical protein